MSSEAKKLAEMIKPEPSEYTHGYWQKHEVKPLTAQIQAAIDERVAPLTQLLSEPVQVDLLKHTELDRKVAELEQKVEALERLEEKRWDGLGELLTKAIEYGKRGKP